MKLACPYCGQHVEVDNSRTGGVAVCPHPTCGKEFVTPALQSQARAVAKVINRIPTSAIHGATFFRSLVLALACSALAIAPATCAILNYLGANSYEDVYGLSRPIKYEHSGGRGYSRSIRLANDMEFLLENLYRYLTSSHGWASLATAAILTIPCFYCVRIARQNYQISIWTDRRYKSAIAWLTIVATIAWFAS